MTKQGRLGYNSSNGRYGLLSSNCAGKDTGINRSIIRFGRCGTDVHRTLCPRQGARGLLMDGTAVESAFALLLTKVTKPPYPAKSS